MVPNDDVPLDLPPGVEVLFVAGFGPVTRDVAAARTLYAGRLGLPLKAMEGNPDYLHTDALEGAAYLALWPLAQAAESCFGQPDWPADLPVPQAWIEFDVRDVAAASQAMRAAGERLLVDTRTEPWGQVVTRFLSPEGLLVGLTFTPWRRAAP